MRKTLITVIVCLALLVFGFQTGKAQEEPIPCDPEPTDMVIEYGEVITCSIVPVGDIDVFRFDGNEDEVIRILASVPWGSGIQPCIELVAPNNDRLVACNNTGSNHIDTQLDQAGSFTLLIRDLNNNGTGAYSLSLERVIPPSFGTQPIDYGETISDEINPVGDIDLFRFGGAAGNQISVLAAVPWGSGIQPCIELVAPNNDRLVACNNTGSNHIDTQLDQTGSFALLISDLNNNGTGAYSLSLQCLSPPCGSPGEVFCGGRKATIVGTETNDKIIGTDGPDVIHGLGGFDIIWGMGGDDVICGGDGTDNISGRAGDDIIFGGDSHDSIWGGSGNDTLEGGDGNDSIFGGSGNDVVRGDNGNDSLYGVSGVNELYGGAGPDNNDTCYDTAGTFNQGCEVFYEQ